MIDDEPDVAGLIHDILCADRHRCEVAQSGNEAWETFAKGANRIAQAVREETGLRTVFHHHCAGYIETPDERPLAKIAFPEQRRKPELGRLRRARA